MNGWVASNNAGSRVQPPPPQRRASHNVRLHYSGHGRDAILDDWLHLPGHRHRRKFSRFCDICPSSVLVLKPQVEASRTVLVQVMLREMKMDPLSSIAMYAPVSD